MLLKTIRFLVKSFPLGCMTNSNTPEGISEKCYANLISIKDGINLEAQLEQE